MSQSNTLQFITNHDLNLWLLDVSCYADDFTGAWLPDNELLADFCPIVAWKPDEHSCLTPISFVDGGSDYVVMHMATQQWWHGCYENGFGLHTLQTHLRNQAQIF